MLAFVLALVLWWAVSVNAEARRSIPRQTPRKPQKRPLPKLHVLKLPNEIASVGELVLVEVDEVATPAIDESDDYWPDLIDA